MDKAEIEARVQAMLSDVPAGLKQIGDLLQTEAKAACNLFVALTEAVVKAKDLRAAVACVAFYDAHAAVLRENKNIDLAQMREVVRRSAGTTDEKLFVDSIGLNTAIAKAIVARLSVLQALKPGVYVSSQSWGFGQVKSLDTFYGKVIIDFEGKKGHAMSLAVAGQNLEVANDEHLMTRYLKNRDAILDMAKHHPAELVRLTLQSYGPMSVQRLSERLISAGLVKAQDWKAFWDTARRNLKADKTHPVDIPAKRTEPIRLLDEEEDFGDKWLKKFAKERDIKKIYDGTLALLAEKNGELPDSYRDTITARLNFALKGADKTDFARYAQVAVLLRRLNLSSPEEQARQAETLVEKDEQDNFLASLKGLSARDVSALVSFLLAVKPDLKGLILEHLPQLSSVALGATLATLKGDEATGAAVRALLARQTSPLPTLVVWALRNREAAEEWKAPSLNDLITQAIHIVEQRWAGENLKMRNALQAFFDSAKWLEAVCKELEPFERTVMFERIQASRSWDAASQKNLLTRMMRFDPALTKLRRTVRTQQERQHLTSLRSLTAYKLAYDHLINVEIPNNTKDIATARSYGDLRENAEYQFAKDHQRVLLGRQDEMDRNLRILKATDFANCPTDTADLGTRVTVATDRGTQTFTILGELDRDEALNIISCRSRLAAAVTGHKVGDTVTLPSERGTVPAVIKAIEPLNDEVRAWLAAIPTAYEPHA